LEVWEKVYAGDARFLETLHGEYGCITCHGGVSGATDKGAAHEGIVRDPSGEGGTCDTCHAQEVETVRDSLHVDLEGYYTVLRQRSDEAHWDDLMVGFELHCTDCHATCGQCHVSMPTYVGGGLADGHAFKETPSMNLSCTACHGSRIEDEYKGQNEGVRGDAHWTKQGMTCFECHTGDELHGEMGERNHRYDGPQEPSCTAPDCHEGVGSGEDEVILHDETHLEKMSCQVCHAQPYKQCYNCHVQQSDAGIPYFTTDDPEISVKIGFNPRQSEERPWEYVVLRHVPVARDSFEYYGEGLLPNFDALPTWTYATPHSIAKNTPQNESCEACHGNPEVFLTADDIDPDEREANKDVIVTSIP
jgi:thiosulfate/3-mercaptopyruvate sulfurtransferase